MVKIAEKLIAQCKGSLGSWSKSYTASEGEKGGRICDGESVTEIQNSPVAGQWTTFLPTVIKKEYDHSDNEKAKENANTENSDNENENVNTNTAN